MIRIDMDMPDKCSECVFAHHDKFGFSGSCIVMFGEPQIIDFGSGKRQDWCPLQPIVTCGECRHWKNHGAESTAWTPCMDIEYSKDFFCGRAERKDNQQ